LCKTSYEEQANGVTCRDSDQRTRKHNVAKTQQRELVLVGPKILWHQNLDGSVERLGHGHHDVGAEHPKDVVQEQAALEYHEVRQSALPMLRVSADCHTESYQKERSNLVASNRDQRHALDRERQANDVVGDPVLRDGIPSRDGDGNQYAHNVDVVPLVHVLLCSRSLHVVPFEFQCTTSHEVRSIRHTL